MGEQSVENLTIFGFHSKIDKRYSSFALPFSKNTIGIIFDIRNLSIATSSERVWENELKKYFIKMQ